MNEKEIRKNVLIIDDSTEIQKLLRFWLKNEDIILHEAFKGDQGIKIAKNLIPDLILLDVGLPDKDGFEICKILKNDELTRLIPIVFLTGADETRDKIQGLNLGAVDYITKPFDPGELVARVRAAIRTKELEVFNAELERKVSERTRELRVSNEKLNLEIKERRFIEEEIRKHRDHLEELVKEKTIDLEAALGLAVAGNNAKSIFLAQMSHELRTPLNAIIGYSEILLEDVKEENLMHFVPIINPILNAGHNLLNIIDKLLDIAHIESGKKEIHIRDFDFLEFVRELVEEMKPVMDKNQNVFEVHVQENFGIISQDREKLKRSLESLLDNAGKYTNDGEVLLSVTRQQKNGDSLVVFRITDTGIGITNENLEKIFEPFTQADNSYARAYEGVGLGLALVKKYCELMTWEILVDSQFGRGSTFTLSIYENAT